MAVTFLQTGGDVEVTGSPTEKAILQWALKVRFCMVVQFHVVSVLEGNI